MEEKEKSCCCGGGAEKVQEEKSCCHEEKSKEEKACCHEEKEEHCCCGGESKTEKKKKPKAESLSSCCGIDKGTHADSGSSCCGIDKGTHADGGSSCCGVAKKSKTNKYLPFIILAVSLASIIVSGISPFHNRTDGWRYVDFGWIAVILCGYPIFKGAIKNIIKGRVTSALLISVAILACITLEILIYSGALHSGSHSHSNIFAAGEVAFLMFLGEMIEDITVKKARSGISGLVNLAPQIAKYRLSDGSIIEKPVSEVRPGDVVVVLPGDTVSVDGKIVSGSTAIDESIMTGESVPVDKTVGSNVFGGTQNMSGAIEIEVTKTSDKMAVAKLKKLVEEAEGKKAPIARTADKWARIIVPGAILIAVIVFFVTYFGLTDRNIFLSIMRAVTMLVVVCPCALALATPTAIAAGLGNSARRGVLIKSGESLEELSRVETIAFDKTGTLTTGVLIVDELVPYNVTKERLAAVAGAAESLSEHPIAKAITAHCKKIAKLPEAKDTKALVGTGVESHIEGKKITVAKWDYLRDKNIKKSFADEKAETLLRSGKTVVAVVESDELIGLIALSDEIKPEAKDCIERLRTSGIKTVMLTGDNKQVAYSVAMRSGVDDFYAELLPEQKLEKIDELKRVKIKNKDTKVCMVGDGVNDAPALAGADCSMAMGALGSDIAIETADISLMNNDIVNVARTVRLSKRVMTTIKINITLSMMINVLALVLNLLGYLTPVWGALIHNASSVIVVLHSAFLLLHGNREKKTKGKPLSL